MLQMSKRYVYKREDEFSQAKCESILTCAFLCSLRLSKSLLCSFQNVSLWALYEYEIQRQFFYNSALLST